MTSLSIVVPAFNEAARLPASLEHIAAYLATRPARSIELIVADDGSRDATAAIAREHGAIVVALPHNRGKGAAVRAGVLAAQHDRVLVCDADLATPIEELAALDAALDAGADIAIGQRPHAAGGNDTTANGNNPQPLGRRVFGAAYHAIVRHAFHLPLRDTTCGFKLFTRAAAHDLFARSRIDRFAYDVETLYLARDRYRIAEVPVAWQHVEGSRVSLPRDIARTVRDLLAIRFRGRA